MFKSESMYKTNIFALKEDRVKVLEELHKNGAMQVIDLKSSDMDIGQAIPGEKHKLSSDLLLRVSRLVSIQKMPPQKLTTPQSLFGLELPEKEKVKRLSESQIVKDAESFLKEHEKELIELEQTYTNAEEKKEQLYDMKLSIEILNNLEVPLSYLRSSEKIFIMTGRIQTLKLQEMEKEVKSELNGEVEVLSKAFNPKESLAVLVAFSENQNKLGFTAKKHGLSSISIPDIDTKDPIDYIEKESLKCVATKENVFDKIIKIRKNIFTKTILIREELELLKEKTETVHKMRESDRFFVLQGWVPETSLEKVKAMKNVVVTTELATQTIPPLKEEEEGEDVPVKLNNPKWLKPFEMITELYSAPKYKDLDPTFIVGPIFVIFAGFMLTDFFYGLGLVLLGAYLVTKFGKYDPGLKEISVSIIGIGAFSMIFGVLTGSYLGDLPKYLFGIESAQLAFWRDPLTDPLYFLIISIIVALIHVNIGLILGASEDIRKKQYKNFVSERLVWWTLQIAIAGFALSSYIPSMAGTLSMIGKVVGIGSVLLIIFMKGPLGLLDITGFMGDVISYSRLFALALSTAGIAMTFNLLAGLLWPIPYGIGIFSAALIFIIGHLFSFAMNSLGSFVHSIRLQFVEFFGKFYEGGGSRFEPFKEERSYTIVEGEEE